MKRLFVFCTMFALVMPVLVGCEKKAETKKETTTTESTPAGSTTTTETQKVEATGDQAPAETK